MKFEEVFPALREGKKIRRKSWGKDRVYDNTTAVLCFLNVPALLNATDWEIYEEPILDEVERRYLKGVINPFKDKVLWIRKQKCGSKPSHCFLVIGLKNAINNIWLPPFKANSMYLNMKFDKHYTLKELGL